MAKRKAGKRSRKPVETETYSDPEGNELELRKELSPATIAAHLESFLPGL